MEYVCHFLYLTDMKTEAKDHTGGEKRNSCAGLSKNTRSAIQRVRAGRGDFRF